MLRLVLNFTISMWTTHIYHLDSIPHSRLPSFMYDADGQLNVPHREWIADFDRIVNEVRSSHPEDFIGARVQHVLTSAIWKLTRPFPIGYIHDHPICLS